MSVTDPLLKSLKYLVQEFHSVGEDISDHNPYLSQFCVTVEQCFLKGLKKGSWEINQNKHMDRKRFWSLLQSLENNRPMPYAISSAMKAAVEDKRLKTADGKLRYTIRHCLVHRSLPVLIEFLVRWNEQVRDWYYEDQSSGRKAMKHMAEYGGGSSIIIHEELAEQMRSLLLTCSTSLTFNIDLANSFFLDNCWQVPLLKTIEFVPTTHLGIEVVYINGHVIITRLKPGSLAAEELNLGVGDILAEMNGRIIFPAGVSGERDALSVWRHCKEQSLPCKLKVIKPRSPVIGDIYEPLKGTLSEFYNWMDTYFAKCKKNLDDKQDKEAKKERKKFHPSRNEERTPVLDPQAAEEGVGGTFVATYIGEISTGADGGVEQIEAVIKKGLKKKNDKTALNVRITLTQIAVEVAIIGQGEPEPLFNHKYADISSCGKLISDEQHFCYIAGDTFCTLSKQFKGFLFEAQTLSQARTILNGIYQGFKRTTWFM